MSKKKPRPDVVVRLMAVIRRGTRSAMLWSEPFDCQNDKNMQRLYDSVNIIYMDPKRAGDLDIFATGKKKQKSEVKNETRSKCNRYGS
jgi:hypothetical protein